jgi:SAM-dependent methyltransferase
MSDTVNQTTGAGAVGADPWGARARDWAEMEESSRPLFEAILDTTRVGDGTRLLDVGCGSGLACAIAAARGARVSGLDGSAGLLAIARERVPEGDFRVGDLTSLPFDDGSFDVVTSINNFGFAADQLTALREAGRVARPGAQIAIVIWESPEKVKLTAYVGALGPLLPPSPVKVKLFISAAELEQLARRAGLAPQRSLELDWTWQYPDLESALRGLLSGGLSTLAIRAVGEQRVRDALTSALEPFRMPGGGYRLENTVCCFIATARDPK